MNKAEVRVIGVLQEEGQDVLNLSLDTTTLLSLMHLSIKPWKKPLKSAHHGQSQRRTIHG